MIPAMRFKYLKLCAVPVFFLFSMSAMAGTFVGETCINLTAGGLHSGAFRLGVTDVGGNHFSLNGRSQIAFPAVKAASGSADLLTNGQIIILLHTASTPVVGGTIEVEDYSLSISSITLAGSYSMLIVSSNSAAFGVRGFPPLPPTVPPLSPQIRQEQGTALLLDCAGFGF